MGFFNTTPSEPTTAAESFFIADQAQANVSNVQDALDVLYDRVNMFPIVQGDWTVAQTVTPSLVLPEAGDGVDGDYWFAADFPDVWPPTWWLKVDGAWVQLSGGTDFRYITTVPTNDTFPYPTRAMYTPNEGVTYTVYHGSFTYQPTNNNVLQYNNTTHNWEEVTLTTAMNNAGLQVIAPAVVTSYDPVNGFLCVLVDDQELCVYTASGQDYIDGDSVSVIKIDSTFVPLANVSTDIAIDVAGNTNRFGTNSTSDPYILAQYVYDKTGLCGRGHNVLYGAYVDVGADECNIIALNMTTGISTVVATIAEGANMALYRVGSTLIAWSPLTETVYAILADDSVATVGVYNNVSTMSIAGVEYLVVSDSTTSQWTYYNYDGSVSATAAIPAGGNAVLCNGGWMWTNKGDVSAASLTPTFNSFHNVTLNMDGYIQQLNFAVMPDTGELWRAFQSGSPLVYNLRSYSPTVNNSVTNHNHVFAATDEPIQILMSSADGVLAIAGIWHDANPGPAIEPTGSVVWSFDGTLTELARAEETPSIPVPHIAISALVGRVAVVISESDGDISNLVTQVARQISY